MAKMKKVLLMLLEGGSNQDKIAAILHVSKRDVSEASKAIKGHNLTYEAILGMDPVVVEDAFFPRESRGRKKDSAYLQPDMALYIERKKKRHKLPVKQFWQEYVSAALIQEKLAYSYQSFCEQFSAEADRMGATQHFRHTPGEKAYIDWAGDAARLTDRITARRRRRTCSSWRCPSPGCSGPAASRTCASSRGSRATWPPSRCSAASRACWSPTTAPPP